jgi:hypothetical protein
LFDDFVYLLFVEQALRGREGPRQRRLMLQKLSRNTPSDV